MHNHLLTLVIILFLRLTGTAQTKVDFSKIDAWRQNINTKKMEHVRTIYDSGYLEVNKSSAKVIVYNARLNEKEIFQFDSFLSLEMGHYLAFGKVNLEQMFNFIPEDRLILLKTNDVVIMQFDLTETDVLKLKSELQ